MVCVVSIFVFFFFKQKTAYEVRISDWSSDVCSSDLVARDIKLVGRRRGAREQLDLIFVKRVDQRDEARRLVAVLGPHPRDADDDHRMEMSRDREIVGGPARLAAQLPEREDRDAFQCPRHMQRPSTSDREVWDRYKIGRESRR